MKLGLALSGGGIRGIAHAGVLKALEDNNIKMHQKMKRINYCIMMFIQT